MKLSFIIVNYRSEEYLKNCVDSIFKYVRGVDFEIIIVNNDDKKLGKNFSKNVFFSRLSYSADSSKKEQFFEKNNCRDIGDNLKIIEVNENIGFGRGCNLGAKEARGEILCFLNPDTEIISENIEEILREFSENKKVGVIGPKIIEKSGSVQKWITGAELNLWRILKNNFGFVDDKKIWLSSKKQNVAWVTGAVLFIRKKIFEKLNGFDKNFFMYFEDIDLCKRVRLEKYKIIYFPKFTVRHLGGGSVKNDKTQKKDYYKSQDYYFKKWFGNKTKFLVRFLRKFCL